jgi:hypothetical protein
LEIYEPADLRMKQQTVATIATIAATANATGQLGELPIATIAKKAETPAIQPTTVTCFVRSESRPLAVSDVCDCCVVSFIVLSCDPRVVSAERPKLRERRSGSLQRYC